MMLTQIVVALMGVLALSRGTNACENRNVYPGESCCSGTAVNARCTASVYGYAGYCKAPATSGRPASRPNRSNICTLCNQKDGICCPGSRYGSSCYAKNGYCHSAKAGATGTALTCKQCNSPSPKPTPCCPGTKIGYLCHGSFGGPPGFPLCGGGSCGICVAPKTGKVSRTNPAMCVPCGGKGQRKCPGRAGAGCAPRYGQCGGLGYTGAKCCQSGLKCVPQRNKDGKINVHYSQCI